MTRGRSLDIAAASRSSAIEHLFEVARHGIYLGWFDPARADASGTALVVNPWLKSILGYAPDTLDGSVQLFAPEHYADVGARARLIETVLGETGAHDYLIQLRRKDGSLIWAEVTAYTQPDVPGPLRIDALVRDVTARRLREDRARDLYQQLAQSEQMAAIRRKLAEIEHEVSNPLQTILLATERLAEMTLDARTAKGVSDILSAYHRAHRIVLNIRHTAERQTSTRSMVDINEIVLDTLALRMHEQQALNITSTVDLAEDLPEVFADPHQIQQILLNIVINAEQAMASAHNRGALAITTKADTRRQTAVVQVSDDGPGVDESVRSRIFDPFFTTKQPGMGTGLGLALAQALVQEHGGSLLLARNTGAGTTFVIELPMRGLATVIG